MPQNNNAPLVSIVMVNYNQADYTAQCLDSLRAAPPEMPFEIILVDNASHDGSGAWIAARYPEVKLVKSPVNVGIAGGNNLGHRASSGEFVLLLNNDTLVLPGSIERCVDFLKEHPQAGGAGGNLLNADGSFQSSYLDFHSLWTVFLSQTKLGQVFQPEYPSYPRGEKIQEVDWMSTAFMLFPKKVLDQIGCMDEEYFIYSDETDLQYRIHRAGWKIYYLPDVETIHFGGKALDPWRRRRLIYRGFLLFFHQHKGPLQTFLLRVFFITLSALKLPFWALVWLFPCRRERAGHELRSNLDILRMCLKPGIEKP